MRDEEIRKLEREAAAGDAIARQRLEAWRERMRPPEKPIPPDIKSLNQIAQMFRLPSSEDVDDNLIEGSTAYSEMYSQAIEEGMSEEEAERTASLSEDEYRGDAYNQWNAAIQAVATHFFEKVGLGFNPIYRGRGRNRVSYEIKIIPAVNWKESASLLLELMNGVGTFEFDSLRDLMESGPYRSYKDCTLQHLWWIRSYSAVYGGTSPEQMYDRFYR